MSRFEEAPQEVYSLMNTIISDAFPRLNGANIKVIFDTKKRISGGKYVFGRFAKTNELQKYLTADDIAEEGYDYFMYLDKNVYDVIEEPDKIRLIRHELQHSDVNFEAKEPYKVRGHEVEDFYEEIEYNREDPRWGERLLAVAESIYNSEDSGE